jgi:uncharacterized repeat protein (TIGR03803 family)
MKTIAISAVLFFTPRTQAVEPEVLYKFQQVSANPHGLVEGSDGTFYGTVSGSNSNGAGEIFKITLNGEISTLVSFNYTNGAQPMAPLAIDRQGNFYGTTKEGGSGSFGTVFKVTTGGVLSTLVSFDGKNGAHPVAALTLGIDGNFYGTTFGKDDGSNLGTVFKVTGNGSLLTLASFSRTNGAHPCSALVPGKNGEFYGTTEEGGSGPFGTVFKLTTNGVLTTLVSFNYTNGAYPTAPVMLGLDGELYGTTASGGNDTSGWGTIFQTTSNGVLRTLVSFNGANGAYPSAGLVLGPDANLYGTTVYGGNNYLNGNNPGEGTLFRLSRTGALTTLVSFDGNNGAGPFAALVLGNDGDFYGTTMGASNGGGVIFRLVTAPKFGAPTMQPEGSVLLTGTGLPNDSLRIWVTEDLSSRFISWTLLTSNSFDSGGHFSFTDTASIGNRLRFYRLSVP